MILMAWRNSMNVIFESCDSFSQHINKTELISGIPQKYNLFIDEALYSLNACNYFTINYIFYFGKFNQLYNFMRFF